MLVLKEGTSVEVELQLLDGRTLDGVLGHFSPLLPKVTLTPMGESSAASWPVEQVALIGFKRRPGEEVPPRRGLKLAKVETTTGRALEVWVSAAALGSSGGFFGFDPAESAPFERIYFYGHGVSSRQAVRLEEQKPAAVQASVASVDGGAGQKPAGKLRLGEILIEAGLLTAEAIEQGLAEQKKRKGRRLGELLVELKLVKEEEVLAALARKFSLPTVNLDALPGIPEPARELPLDMLLSLQCFPLEATAQTLTVAIGDPMVAEVADTLRLATRKRIIEVLALPSQIKKRLDALAEVRGSKDDLMRKLGGAEAAPAEVLQVVEEGPSPEEEEDERLAAEADEAPIVRLVSQIIVAALEQRASDVHLLPQARGLVVMYRVDGDLREQTVLDRRIARQIVSRVKILAGMDIAERRLPQDGRILLRHKGRDVELRVSNIPSAFGESIVARVLNKEMAVDLKALGLRQEDHERLLLLTRRSFGLILVTGPTGSGKSTTLFALLKEIIKRPLHVITIEDPIESEIAGVNQIQVNKKVELTFSRVLRNILRHDPDVIMVGEIRDQETALIGVEAALTGHLMLTTLHTNTAADTVGRLTDLGVPAYQIASALLGIVSQELVKRLCRCRREVEPSPVVSMLVEKAGLSLGGTLYEPVGCHSCGKTGFRGRTLLYEFMAIEPEVRDAIRRKLPSSALEEAARSSGFLPKAHHAIDLAGRGVISQDDLIGILV